MEQGVSVAPVFSPPSVRSMSATFELVSPMFMAGAMNDRGAQAELRPTAIKGALRFWWRALNWARVRAQHEENNSALVQLHAEESVLFGAAHKEKATPPRGASRVSIQLKSKDLKQLPDNHSLSTGLQYLAGQGLCTVKKATTPSRLLRQAWQSGGRFQLSIQGHRAITDAQWQQLNQAVEAFGLLGCLGSKARNGFGSVALVDVKGAAFDIPATVQAYQSAVRQLFASAASVTGLPPYTALSACSRVDISLAKRGQGLLNQVGDMQRAFRSSLSKEQHPDASRDHDGVKDVALRKLTDYQPQRSAFGLPHNYFFRSLDNKSVPYNVCIDGTSARRASPLFIHQHRIGDQQLIIQMLLPAVFLPGGASMHLGNARFGFRPEDLNWPLLHNWLDRFENRVPVVEAQEVPNG